MSIVKETLDQLLDDATSAGSKALPGVSAAVTTANGVVYAGQAGTKTFETNDMWTMDTVCWIASMTKLISTCAPPEAESG